MGEDVVVEGDASHKHSSVDRTEVKDLWVGEEGTFTVQCNDCFGNATDCGLVSAKATYQDDPEEEVEVKIERDGKGRYSCSLRPMEVRGKTFFLHSCLYA